MRTFYFAKRNKKNDYVYSRTKFSIKKRKKHLADSLADIAHQLRTPLTSINVILSSLENNSNNNKSLIREIKELFIHMDWLLTSLLKLSRIDAGIVMFQSKQIDVSKLICSAFRPFLIQIELHNITSKIDVPNNMIIQGDFSWLSEAIQNIFKNCIENVGDNGKIGIIYSDNPIFSEIIIHDSGNGFEKEDLHCIFDRFYRGKNTSTTGYGIGLALCKMIVTGHGRAIIAKNHSQGGAIFTIRFPT